MSLAPDLLDQARHLMELDARRPKQANLRRAVSTAYYAVFHLLIGAASSRLVRSKSLRPLVARAFTHTEMRDVARGFAEINAKQIPRKEHVYIRELCGRVVPGHPWKQVPAEFETISRSFIELQQARHDADYKIDHKLTRSEARDLVDLAAHAFTAWDAIKASTESEVFLTALLLSKRWDRH